MKINASRYVAESQDEGARLVIKTDRKELREQLKTIHLSAIPPSSVVVDAGCGVGIGSEIMLELLGRRHYPSKLYLLDLSEQRLADAKKRLAPFSSRIKIIAKKCDIVDIPLSADSVDFIFCRFVFEYLNSPKKVVNEFKRILKPGGRMVIGDLDTCAMAFYPIDPELYNHLKQLFKQIANPDYDIAVGRKLFSFVESSEMQKIHVYMLGHNVIHGNTSYSIKKNWEMKLDKIISYISKNKNDLGFELKHFKEQFLLFLDTPGLFSYTPYIMVEGTKE
ncbi:MAG: class I SAM-dependent methyltransferase [Chitinispirillaceae bacterium]|nr:class I SAM-dependent methyltransferase [Chitinispirillaceae bacterium]